MLDTDLFERQTTFSKNLVKMFRPKTFGHPRFEFDKKATASFNGSYFRMCVTTSTHDFLREARNIMQVKHKCQEFLYVHSPHSGLSLNAKPLGKVSCDSQLPCQL